MWDSHLVPHTNSVVKFLFLRSSSIAVEKKEGKGGHVSPVV